jgi:tRNA (guanine37-N1)-methyltransferase
VQIDILTALPQLVESPLSQSIVGRASAAKTITIRVLDIRDFATDKHRTIDDYPYGGGGGMVLKPEPIFAAVEHIERETQAEGGKIDEVIFMTPDGEHLTQTVATSLSLAKHLVVLAGHYKGVDQRVRDDLVTREVSIGDYVLSGGELPALVLVDCIVRLIPGAIGDASSALSDSFQDGLLGAPVYTRPAEFRGKSVPEVLLSGDHERISEWREETRRSRTEKRRPDLLD